MRMNKGLPVSKRPKRSSLKLLIDSEVRLFRSLPLRSRNTTMKISKKQHRNFKHRL
jgi:hypothetical protein